MSDLKDKVYIDNDIWLKVIDRVAPWFNDRDDAINWFFYQNLSYFGGATAEEVMTARRERGYRALLEYIDLKEKGML